jgi:DNA-binding SARP family transcriptional activator
MEKFAATKRALKPAFRTAIKHIDERLARGVAAPADDQPRPARLILFGPPQLRVEDQPVPASAWRAQRAFQMLVYLALHPRGASKDDLLERFWPGRQAAAGRRNFHPTLSYIRRVLPGTSEAPILREAEFYRLNPAYPLTCDVWDLERATSEASATRDPRERRAALARAAVLATGVFLEGFYDDWADELQARTRARVEKLLLELGGLCAQAADFEAALDHFRRASELDEYREATRLAVIECQIRLGNRRAAVVEYEKLKTLLRTELQVDPLPETQEAMDRILEGRGVHGWPEGSADGTPHPKGAQRTAASSQVRIKAAVRG